ncbi:MAG: heme exporter protein CcmD [Betaproteobacteria bacterium]|nr:heme exporter protein CcmD [Betaproteobacteria bacterium]
MSWASWSDFFAMGGYAVYVWGSYAVTAGLILAEVIMLGIRKRAAKARLAAGRGAGMP